MTPVRNTHTGCAVSTVAGHCHFVRTQGQTRFSVVVDNIDYKNINRWMQQRCH